jgi:hypothetical protein
MLKNEENDIARYSIAADAAAKAVGALSPNGVSEHR